MTRIVGKRPALWMVVLVAVTMIGLVTLGAGQTPAGRGGQRGGGQRGGAAEPGNTKPVAWLGGKVPNLKPVDQHLSDPALVGAIDLHAHLNPDSSGGGQEPRAIDVIDDARQMKERGARGFVYKTHMDTGSAGSAYLARKVVPGVEVFGRYALNTTTGGMNPAAVIQFTHIAGGYGRIIEMPTRDSENTYKNMMGRGGEDTRPWITPWAKLFPDRMTYVPTVKNGQLLPETKALITMLATLKTSSDAPIVLATGHATNEEHVLIAKEGRRLGVTVLLTHPDSLPVDQAQELAKLGAFIEVNASGGFAHGADAETWAPKTVDRIHKIGADQVVMGSDAGQTDRPLPGDELSMAAKALRAHGLTENELNKIFKENPARVLGLPAQAPKPSAAP
jgi:hypothetical protein